MLSAKDIGLTFNKHKPEIVANSDASWNVVPIPFGGHVVFYGGAAVSYSARKVKIVPQSSAEAETAAYSKAAKDVRPLRDEHRRPRGLPAQAVAARHHQHKCDKNQAAVSSIKNAGSTQRNRHYERWLREQYLDLISTPLWISTDPDIMVADIFTKPLDKTAFLKFRAVLLNYGLGKNA